MGESDDTFLSHDRKKTKCLQTTKKKTTNLYILLRPSLPNKKSHHQRHFDNEIDDPVMRKPAKLTPPNRQPFGHDLTKRYLLELIGVTKSWKIDHRKQWKCTVYVIWVARKPVTLKKVVLCVCVCFGMKNTIDIWDWVCVSSGCFLIGLIAVYL